MLVWVHGGDKLDLYPKIPPLWREQVVKIYLRSRRNLHCWATVACMCIWRMQNNLLSWNAPKTGHTSWRAWGQSFRWAATTFQRAFLRDPKILMLDEATASLDSESEAMVQRALEKLMENPCNFSHCAPFIYNCWCGQCYFIEHGEVAGSGTPSRTFGVSRTVCRVRTWANY